MFLANQKAFVICTRVTSLHSCYTFCTRVTEELHSFFSQSELSNFFVYIIRRNKECIDFFFVVDVPKFEFLVLIDIQNYMELYQNLISKCNLHKKL